MVPNDKSLYNARKAYARGYLSKIDASQSSISDISEKEIDEFLWKMELCFPVQLLRVALITSLLMGPNHAATFVNLAERMYYATQSEDRKPTSLKRKIIKYGSVNVMYHGYYYPFHFFQGYY